MFALLLYFYHAFSNLLNKHFDFNATEKPLVLYESQHFKFVNKPPDMRINSNNGTHYTLQTFLCEKYPECANEKLIHNFYFVHRLDYATSGIICIPMTKQSCKVIAKVFESRVAEKYYIAIVRGILSQRIITINDAIGEDSSATINQKMCTNDNKHCTHARNATTIILALEDGFYENYPGTKILIRPVTGRRHQIRVHCSRLGHSIVGDYTYSNKTDSEPCRMFLHSLRLVLPNALESVDLQTKDPFSFNETANGNKNWMVNNRYCSVQEGFTILKMQKMQIASCKTDIIPNLK